MKFFIVLALATLSLSASAVVPKLAPAEVLAARSNRMFPVTTYKLDIEVPCYANVVGTVGTVANSMAVVGVMLQDNSRPNQPRCMGIERKTVSVSVSAEVVSDVLILGAPRDLRVE